MLKANKGPVDRYSTATPTHEHKPAHTQLLNDVKYTCIQTISSAGGFVIGTCPLNSSKYDTFD